MNATAAHRRKAFIDLAEKLELSFDEEGRELLDHEFTAFPIFREGDGGILKHAVSGTFSNTRFALFDYRPNAVGRPWQTVVAFQLQKTRLPAFALRPRQSLHPPEPSKSEAEVLLTDCPNFTINYTLHGSNDEAIQRFFSRRATQYLGRAAHFSIEGGGDWLIVYRQDYRCPPRLLQTLLRDAWNAYRVFRVR